MRKKAEWCEEEKNICRWLKLKKYLRLSRAVKHRMSPSDSKHLHQNPLVLFGHPTYIFIMIFVLNGVGQGVHHTLHLTPIGYLVNCA